METNVYLDAHKKEAVKQYLEEWGLRLVEELEELARTAELEQSAIYGKARAAARELL